MLAYCPKVPFSVKGLRPRITLPHAQPDRIVSGLPSLVYTGTHQLFSDAPSQPVARYVQADQLDRVSAFDGLFRFTIMELRVTCRAPINFRDQEGRGRI